MRASEDTSPRSARPSDIVAILAARAGRFGRWPALRQAITGQETTVELSWQSWLEQAQVLANALRAYGVQAGQRVALLARSSPRWLVADIAILMAGGVSVPLPRSVPAAAHARMLLETHPRVVFVGDVRDWRRLREHSPSLEASTQVILFDAEGVGALSYSGMRPVSLEDALVRGRAIIERGDGLRPVRTDRGSDAPATIVYSAGRTGPARAAVLSHGAIVSKVLALRGVLILPRSATQLLVLPLWTQFGRLMAWAAIDQGATTWIQPGVASHGPDLAARFNHARPHFFAGTPRVFEGLAKHILTEREGPAGAPGRMTLALAKPFLEQGAKARGRRALAQMDIRLARRLLRTRVRYLLGGRIQHLICGGSDLPESVAHLFHFAGLPILEGYGSSEAVGAATANRPGDIRPGSVGTPLADVEMALSPDGEILLRGSGLFSGYLSPPYDAPEPALVRARDEAGWFHTRDLGILEEGWLYLTGRREDLLRLSSGRLVAPSGIEARIASDPRIAHAVVCGESRPYLTVLLWRADSQDLEAHQAQRLVDEVNHGRARHEQIQRFHVVTEPLLAAEGELSSRGDPVRHKIYERLREVIDSLYVPS